MNKILQSYFAAACLLTTCCSAQVTHVNDLLGSRKELFESGFENWDVDSVVRHGKVGDGGSYVVRLEDATGVQFDLVSANLGCWTDKEKRDNIQVFYLVFERADKERRFFKMEVGSPEGRLVIEILQEFLKTERVSSEKERLMISELLAHMQTRDRWVGFFGKNKAKTKRGGLKGVRDRGKGRQD